MLNLIGRNKELFTEDIKNHKEELEQIVSNSSFLVIGGAGSIGQAVVKEIGILWTPHHPVWFLVQSYQIS